MANDAIALFDDGDYLPCKASAPVTGKRFVAISGGRDANGNIQVAHAAAGANVLGVAQFDSADHDDQYVTVAAGIGLIVPVTAGAAIAAGARIASDATGQAVTVTAAAGAVGHAVGVAIDAAAAGADVFVRLAPHSFTG
jgi:hypothetical protein